MKKIEEYTLGEALNVVLDTDVDEYESSDELLDALTAAFWIMFEECYYGK